MKGQTKACTLSPQKIEAPQICPIVHEKIPKTCKTMFHVEADEQSHTSFYPVNLCHDQLKHLNDTSHTRNFFRSNQPQITNTDTGISKDLHELFLKYYEKIRIMVWSFKKSVSSTPNTFWENEFIQECCYELLEVLITLDQHKKKFELKSSIPIETHTRTAAKHTMPTLVF
jgi:hypothetical protein